MSEVVPEGWEISTLKEVVFKVVDNRGKTPPVSKHGFKLLEVSSVRNERKTVDSELTEETCCYKKFMKTGLGTEIQKLVIQ
jgi:type I restriction enzyme S subunit